MGDSPEIRINKQTAQSTSINAETMMEQEVHQNASMEESRQKMAGGLMGQLNQRVYRESRVLEEEYRNGPPSNLKKPKEIEAWKNSMRGKITAAKEKEKQEIAEREKLLDIGQIMVNDMQQRLTAMNNQYMVETISLEFQESMKQNDFSLTQLLKDGQAQPQVQELADMLVQLRGIQAGTMTIEMSKEMIDRYRALKLNVHAAAATLLQTPDAALDAHFIQTLLIHCVATGLSALVNQMSLDKVSAEQFMKLNDIAAASAVAVGTMFQSKNYKDRQERRHKKEPEKKVEIQDKAKANLDYLNRGIQPDGQTITREIDDYRELVKEILKNEIETLELKDFELAVHRLEENLHNNLSKIRKLLSSYRNQFLGIESIEAEIRTKAGRLLGASLLTEESIELSKIRTVIEQAINSQDGKLQNLRNRIAKAKQSTGLAGLLGSISAEKLLEIVGKEDEAEETFEQRLKELAEQAKRNLAAAETIVAEKVTPFNRYRTMQAMISIYADTLLFGTEAVVAITAEDYLKNVNLYSPAIAKSENELKKIISTTKGDKLKERKSPADRMKEMLRGGELCGWVGFADAFRGNEDTLMNLIEEALTKGILVIDGHEQVKKFVDLDTIPAAAFANFVKTLRTQLGKTAESWSIAKTIQGVDEEITKEVLWEMLSGTVTSETMMERLLAKIDKAKLNEENNRHRFSALLVGADTLDTAHQYRYMDAQVNFKDKLRPVQREKRAESARMIWNLLRKLGKDGEVQNNYLTKTSNWLGKQVWQDSHKVEDKIVELLENESEKTGHSPEMMKEITDAVKLLKADKDNNPVYEMRLMGLDGILLETPEMAKAFTGDDYDNYADKIKSMRKWYFPRLIELEARLEEIAKAHPEVIAQTRRNMTKIAAMLEPQGEGLPTEAMEKKNYQLCGVKNWEEALERCEAMFKAENASQLQKAQKTAGKKESMIAELKSRHDGIYELLLPRLMERQDVWNAAMNADGAREAFLEQLDKKLKEPMTILNEFYTKDIQIQILMTDHMTEQLLDHSSEESIDWAEAFKTRFNRIYEHSVGGRSLKGEYDAVTKKYPELAKYLPRILFQNEGGMLTLADKEKLKVMLEKAAENVPENEKTLDEAFQKMSATMGPGARQYLAEKILNTAPEVFKANVGQWIAEFSLETQKKSAEVEAAKSAFRIRREAWEKIQAKQAEGKGKDTNAVLLEDFRKKFYTGQVPGVETLDPVKDQAIIKRLDRIDEIEALNITDSLIESERIDLTDCMSAAAYTMEDAPYNALIDQRILYLKASMAASTIFIAVMEEKEIPEEQQLRLRRGLLEYFHGDLLELDALSKMEQLKTQTEELLEDETTRFYLADCISMLGEVAFDDLSGEELKSHGVADRKTLEYAIEGTSDEQVINQYSQLNVEQRKLFAMGLSKPTRPSQILLFNEAISAYIEGNTFEPEINYAKAKYHLFGKEELLNKQAYQDAMAFVRDCTRARFAALPVDFELLSNSKLSLEKAKEYRKADIKQEPSAVETTEEFIGKLEEVLEGSDTEELQKFRGFDELEQNMVILALQNRTMLDQTTVPGLTDFVNPKMREEFKAECTINRRALAVRPVTSAMRTQALETLFSYQLRDDVDYRNRKLKKSDFAASALTRKNAVDWSLFSNAVALVEEIEEETLRLSMLRQASENIADCGVEVIETEYKKHQKRIETEKNPYNAQEFEAYLVEQAKADGKLSILAGFTSLDTREKELFVKALGNREILDISKEGITANRFGWGERDYADPVGRNLLLDEYLEHSQGEGDGVILDENAYTQALKSTLSIQVDDSLSVEELREMKLQDAQTSGKKWFKEGRNTAVDWKLVSRALQLVYRAMGERDAFLQDRELYVSQGDLSQTGRFQFETEYLRQNIHNAGNRLTRYLGRRLKSNAEDFLKTPSVHIKVPLMNPIDTDGEWHDMINDAVGFVGDFYEDSVGRDIMENFISETSADKVEEVLGDLGDYVGYVNAGLHIAKDAYGHYKLMKNESEAESHRQEDEERTEEAAKKQTARQKAFSDRAIEDHSEHQELAKSQAHEHLNDDLINSVAEIAGSVISNIVEDETGLIELACAEAGEFINFLRRSINEKSHVKKYFQRNGSVEKLRTAPEIAAGSLTKIDDLDLIRDARGFENYTEMASYVGLNTTRSLLYCAGPYNPQVRLRLLAIASLVALGKKDMIGRFDSAAANDVYEALVGADYR